MSGDNIWRIGKHWVLSPPATREEAERISERLGLPLPSAADLDTTYGWADLGTHLHGIIERAHQGHNVPHVDYSVIDPNTPRPRLPPGLARELVVKAERTLRALFPPPCLDPSPSPTLDPPSIDG